MHSIEARTVDVRPSSGKLGILLPGLGAVATTMIAGVMLARRGLADPVGSLTQLGTIRTGLGRESRAKLTSILPFASLDDLEFGGWDIFPGNAYEAAENARVLSEAHLRAVKDELERIAPMPAAFYPGYVRRLSGPHTKSAVSKAEMVEELRDDIRMFIRTHGCARAVCVWCGSTEAMMTQHEVHQTVDAFEHGLAHDSPNIGNSQLYAWACLQEGVPFANGSPNLCVNFPAAYELAIRKGVPICGRDFKTGQTLVKTALAPMLKARMLGLRGWYSTNILGNRDGQVLDDPESCRAKTESKLGVLESILPREADTLYGNYDHRVRIDYYPPRGDEKEGWDNIDLFGWLGYPMQLKLNFQCRDSILAAPLVLDLALLLDLAHRAGHAGAQDWLGFFFKSPMTNGDAHSMMTGDSAPVPVHDLFIQRARLANALRRMMGEPAIGAEALD